MRCDFSNQNVDSPDHGATGATLRTWRRRRDYPDRGGDGATKNQFLGTKAETTRLSRPKRRRYAQTFAAHSAIHIQNFQTQTLGATMQFGSKSGCVATLKVWTWVRVDQTCSCLKLHDQTWRRHDHTWLYMIIPALDMLMHEITWSDKSWW